MERLQWCLSHSGGAERLEGQRDKQEGWLPSDIHVVLSFNGFNAFSAFSTFNRFDHCLGWRSDYPLLIVGDSKVPRIAGCSKNMCTILHALFQLVQNVRFLVYDLAGQEFSAFLADGGLR